MSGSKKLSEVNAVSNGIAMLSGSLQRILRTKCSGNLVYSPFCINAVCAMAKLGAAGSTEAEMVNVLKIPVKNKNLIKGNKKILELIKEDREGCTLDAAYRLYSPVGVEIKASYKDAIESTFEADLRQLNFSKNQEAAKTINAWVEDVTKEKVSDTVAPELLNEATRIVLVSGVYFKGFWKIKFDPGDTCLEPFQISEFETKDVDMMYTHGKFNYGYLRDLKLEVLELEYKGDILSMLIYLPNKDSSMEQLENTLAVKLPTYIISRMSKACEGMISIPRFQVEATLNLIPAFQALGLTDMFSETKADFSGISKAGNSLRVSSILQKVLIAVDEDGSEPANGTARALRCSMPMRFTANRPFIFHLIDKRTDLILLAGTFLIPDA